jgi:hypothetical protein
VLPEIGEYGRASTTVANAYVQPIMARYLARLEGAFVTDGYRGPLHIMTSNGGTMPAEQARELPVRLIESGPAAGIHATVAYGERLGRANLIAFDMGGTTAKVCLIRDGAPFWTTLFEAGRVSRFARAAVCLFACPPSTSWRSGRAAAASRESTRSAHWQLARTARGRPRTGLLRTRRRRADGDRRRPRAGYLDASAFLGRLRWLSTPDRARDVIARRVRRAP